MARDMRDDDPEIDEDGEVDVESYPVPPELAPYFDDEDEDGPDDDAAADALAEWDESKHKRGQPGNAGQFGPGGSTATKREDDDPDDEDFDDYERISDDEYDKQKRLAESALIASSRLQRMAKDRDNRPWGDYENAEFRPQAFESYADLRAAAERKFPEFAKITNHGAGLAEAVGAKVFHGDMGAAVKHAESNPDVPVFVLGTIKSDQRAKEKIDGKFGGDASQLTDMVRGALVVPSYQSAGDAFKKLAIMARKHGWDIQQVADRVNAPLPGGYRDLNILIRSPEGFVAELQVLTSDMFVAKESRGHALYESVRKITEAASKEGRDMTKDEAASVAKWRAEMSSMYDAAHKASLERAVKHGKR